MGKRKSFALFLVATGFLLATTLPSWAVPNLQIYIPGATYDTATETWIINSYEYTLQVIGANLDVLDVKFALAVPTDEDGYIEVTWLDPLSSDYGTGDVASLTLYDPGYLADPNRLPYEDYRDSYDEEGENPDPATYGFALNSYPIMGDGRQLPGAGVFPTDFYEYFIGDFGTDDVVQNYIPGDEWGDTAPGDLKEFWISVHGYTWVDIVAYDHVVLSNNKAKYVFTPFSHDGGSTPVPEPATLLLLASGLIGVAGLRKKVRKG
jgi:hypothetical protein